ACPCRSARLLSRSCYLAGTEPPVFRRIAPPSAAELQALVKRIAERIGRALERQGVLTRDAESSYLALEPDAGGAMDDLLAYCAVLKLAYSANTAGKPCTYKVLIRRREAVSCV